MRARRESRGDTSHDRSAPVDSTAGRLAGEEGGTGATHGARVPWLAVAGAGNSVEELGAPVSVLATLSLSICDGVTPRPYIEQLGFAQNSHEPTGIRGDPHSPQGEVMTWPPERRRAHAVAAVRSVR